MKSYAVDDWVVYYHQVTSPIPNPNALHVWPAESGDTYRYVEPRLWRVIQVGLDGSIKALDSTGYVHRTRVDDPLIEKANWWWRVRHRRFLACA